MDRSLMFAACVALSGASAAGCAGTSPGSAGAAGANSAAAGTSGAGTSDAGTSSAGTSSAGTSSAGTSGAATSGAGTSGRPAGVAGGPGDLAPALGTPGVWEEVTAPDMVMGDFGMGSIVVDPARPTDVYIGGYGSIWKSTDYGLKWSKIDSNPNPPSLPLGHVLAVAGTTPATLWMANLIGEKHVFKSTDGGLTFTLTGTIPEQPSAASLYSIVVDPHVPNHLITGLHEQDKVLESNDGGETWHFVSGNGWPGGGGKSWFPFFVETGDDAKTSVTWFAIGQDGGSAVMTKDGGKNWSVPKGLESLQHPHGNSALFQDGNTLFVAGVGGPQGEGVYRSTDLGLNWTQITKGSGGLVWGSSKNLHVMWGWACGGCGLDAGGPQYQTALQPGDTWSKPTLPARFIWGPNSVATTSDGRHTIYVGSMWRTGIWRYVEP
ncbi:MAG: hypothetical protein WDO74_26995 [Pseudomonadota bacterium]